MALCSLACMSASLLGAGPDEWTFQISNDLLFQKNATATEVESGSNPTNSVNPSNPVIPNGPANHPNQFMEALTIAGQWGKWTAGITLRDGNFYQQSSNVTLKDSDASIYRKFVRYNSGVWSGQGGHFYAVLGRGMVLSVVPNDKLLKDRAIEGVEARYQDGRLDLRLVGGTVTSEARDQRWRTHGGEASFEYMASNRFGLRAGRIEDLMTPLMAVPMGLRVSRSATLSGDNLGNVFNYYAEVGHIDYKDKQALPFATEVDPRKGDAMYGNAVIHTGGLFLMAEYKNYKNFDNELNNPPLADRDIEKNQLSNAAGQRLYSQFTFPRPDFTLLLSVGRYREGRQGGSNVYGGFKVQDWLDRISATYTYGLRTVNYQEKKTDAVLTTLLAPLWSLEFTYRDKRYRTPGSEPIQEMDITSQLARSPWGAIYFTHQFSTIPVFDAHHLYSGGLRINLRKGSYLDVSGGRQRGGEVCAGGQCVTLPPFKGWKIATHLVFK